MRKMAFVLAAMGVLAGASAEARPVALSPATIDTELMRTFERDYGVRELDELRAALDQALTAELSEEGASIEPGAPVRFEVSVLEAKPSKPTQEQLRRQPGLDYFSSISLGGAALRGRFVDESGRTVAEVEHRGFENDLTAFPPVGAWEDARRAIRVFADKAGKAYKAQVH